MAKSIEFHISVDEIQQEIRDMRISQSVDRKGFRALIRKRLNEAKKEVTKAAKDAADFDPREARRAVKVQLYKKILGANINILDNKKATYFREYSRPRKLKPGQRGGNRMPRTEATERRNRYFGESRAFVLRYINSSTRNRYWRTRNNRGVAKLVGGRGKNRHTSASLDSKRDGNRGRIKNGNSWFMSSGTRYIEIAANRISDDLVNKVINDFNNSK